jgi:hypothetical protein
MSVCIYRVKAKCRVEARVSLANLQQVTPPPGYVAGNNLAGNTDRVTTLQNLRAVGIEYLVIQVAMCID